MSSWKLPMAMIACLVLAGAARAEPELLPPPREVESHVTFEKTPNGYQIILSRKASERMRDALGVVGDGKSVVELIKLCTKDLNDPDAERKLEVMAWVLKTQAPALKKALDENMGAGGAVIRVFGVEKKKLPERPLLKAIGEAFIPDDVKDQIKTGMSILNTVPLYWKVEGRK
jgi:hypothetical protein